MLTKGEPERGSEGSTLIELVLVILVLGVLAAFTLPRLAGLSSSARLATLDPASGTMKNVIATVRSKTYAQDPQTHQGFNFQPPAEL